MTAQVETTAAADRARHRGDAAPAPDRDRGADLGATPAGRAAIWNAAGWAALLLWQLWLSRAVIRSAGDAAWGLWATIAAFKSFVLLLDGGLAQGVVRDAGLVSSVSDGTAAPLRIRAAWRCGAGLAIASIVVAAALGPWTAGFLGLHGAIAGQAQALVLLHGVDAGAALATGPLAAILRGRRRFGALAATNVALAAGGVLLLTLLLPSGGALGAAGAVLGARALCAVATWRWMRRSGLLPASRAATAADARAAWRGVVRSAVPVWITATAMQLSMRADVPIVGWFFGADAAGYYDLGQQIPVAAMSLLFAICSFALPGFVADLAAGDRTALHRRLERVVFMACLLTGLGFGVLIALADDVLTAWLGRAPAQSVLVARLYALAWATNAAAYVVAQVAIAQDRFALLTRSLVGCSLANFALSVALAAGGWAAGPAWATLGLLGLWDLVLAPRLLFRELQLPARATLRAAVAGWALGAALAALVAAGVWLLPWSPLPRVIAAAIAVGALAAIVLDLTVRRQSTLRMMSWRSLRFVFRRAGN